MPTCTCGPWPHPLLACRAAPVLFSGCAGSLWVADSGFDVSVAALLVLSLLDLSLPSLQAVPVGRDRSWVDALHHVKFVLGLYVVIIIIITLLCHPCTLIICILSSHLLPIIMAMSQAGVLRFAHMDTWVEEAVVPLLQSLFTRRGGVAPFSSSSPHPQFITLVVHRSSSAHHTCCPYQVIAIDLSERICDLR